MQAGLNLQPGDPQLPPDDADELEKIRAEHIILPIIILSIFYIAAFLAFIFNCCKYVMCVCGGGG